MTNTSAIPVDSSVALGYEQAPPEVQEQIQATIRTQLEQARHKRAWREMMVARDALAAEAQRNGLTEEILEELLRDE